MKITKTASGNKISISKKEWESMGKKAGWIKTAQMGIDEAISGVGAGIAQGGKEKQQEYAQRIMNGEPREQVLQGQGPNMVQEVDQIIAQQTATKTQQPSEWPNALRSTQQYSLSASEQWAMSTGDPSIIEFISRMNQDLRDGQVQQYTNDIKLVTQAMGGDKAALEQLRLRSGGQAMPLQTA